MNGVWDEPTTKEWIGKWNLPCRISSRSNLDEIQGATGWSQESVIGTKAHIIRGFRFLKPSLNFIQLPFIFLNVVSFHKLPTHCRALAMISVRGYDEGVVLVDPRKELHAGLWSLFVGATAFLVARLWSKANRRNDLWWDDYILIFCWVSLHTRFPSVVCLLCRRPVG